MKNTIGIKLLSSLLTLLLVFSSVAVLLPQKAYAAVSPASFSSSSLTKDEVKEIVKTALKYGSDVTAKWKEGGVDKEQSLKFTSMQECLDYELLRGYLDSVSTADSKYTIYVNRYTGVMYYKNNVTGQILSSNPFDPADQTTESTARELLSQISISFTPVGENEVEYNSTQWAAEYAQISTSKIENGIRVNYTLGDTTTRFFLPGRITVEDFQNSFLIPMIKTFTEKMKEYCSGLVDNVDKLEFLDGVDPETGLSKSGEYEVYLDVYEYEDKTVQIINTNKNKKTRKYVDTDGREPREIGPGLQKYVENMQNVYESLKKTEPAKYDVLYDISTSISSLLGKFKLISLQDTENVRGKEENHQQIITEYYSNPDLEITVTHEPFFLCNIDQSNSDDITDARLTSMILSQYVENYTYSDMYNNERALGYEDKTAEKPVFRCALEYRFNEDGSLSTALPANSLSFDESKYTFNSITPLEYFGAGNIKTEGALFFPDGSGTIIDFEEFSKSKIAIYGSGEVFGSDYAYYTITGVHHEQISMPVYGVTNRVNTNQATLDGAFTAEPTMMSGYFAILEEGASLAKLTYKTDGSSDKYANVYATFNPYPSDTCQLTVTGGTYTIVSDSKYNGSYVTTYKMLTDDVVGLNYSAYLTANSLNEGAGMQSFYPATYSGMAAYYRDYLIKNGVLTALTDTNEDLPLYIEALGSMKIQDKFLTFPITKKIALTTFEDVATMYSELEAQNVKNINFRLSGFANEGMDYTYPVRVKWERCVGGRRGFRDLLETANAKSAEAGKNFGIYPEFDFMYIHEQKSFDGIKLKGNAARMVDNRYASKHVIDSTALNEFVNFFVMVVSPDRFDALYSKFLKKYSKYDVSGISVSTLGSDLNSNFDDEQPVNRDEAQNYISALLARMTEQDHYTLMAEMGNIYSVRYMTHLLKVSIDSSHFRYSSYTVPFVGMVLHGFVNYTGSPINYAGTTEYEFLRAIESGASLYYILCTQNSEEMKDDESLSKYYGVDYATWKDKIVSTYAELNALLKDYQTYRITDHRLILGERVIEPSEMAENYETLKDEFLTMVSDQLNDAINEKIQSLRLAGEPEGKIKLTVDEAALLNVLADNLALEGDERDSILDAAYVARFSALIKTFTDEYNGSGAQLAFTAKTSPDGDGFEYDSAYAFITESEATDDSYVTTDYTSDLNNIILVTYSNGTESVSFILNYNIYTVEVRLNGTTYTIPKYAYTKVA